MTWHVLLAVKISMVALSLSAGAVVGEVDCRPHPNQPKASQEESDQVRSFGLCWAAPAPRVAATGWQDSPVPSSPGSAWVPRPAFTTVLQLLASSDLPVRMQSPH